MSRLLQDLEAALPDLSKAVFSQPGDKLSYSKVLLRPVQIKGERLYQAECFRDNKAYHKNLSADEALRFVENELDGRCRQVLIVSSQGSFQYNLKQNGTYKLTGKAAALPVPGGAAAHNREKEYILKEGDNIPALVDLGVFTKDFKVVRSKYDKYKQINRFVELVAQGVAGEDYKQISILDFGCGKSYLTFILYYYFAVKLGMKTSIIGYDLKADVVERCGKIAQEYGYEGLRFEVADVTKDKLADQKIDMVVTLHACDVATDYALAYAINRKVKHIYSVPCCQHEINSSISRGGELDIFMDHGIIKERMSALLTDSIRSAVLSDKGYEVDMIEFIDFEHSPKNLMIRAKHSGRSRSGSRKKAEELKERYGFRHSLLELTD